MPRKNRFLTTKNMCLISVGVSFTAAAAQMYIPLPMPLNITLQTFAIALLAVVFGAKIGTTSAIVYVTIGAIGLPVFSGFRGGYQMLFGVSGGFILSFPALAFFAGVFAKKGGVAHTVTGVVIGVIVNYICGAVVYSAVVGVTFKAAVSACVLAYIPTDTVKVVFVAVLGEKLKRMFESKANYLSP